MAKYKKYDIANFSSWCSVDSYITLMGRDGWKLASMVYAEFEGYVVVMEK